MQSPGLVDRLLVADGLSDGCLVVWPRLGPRTFELDSSLLTFAQILCEEMARSSVHVMLCLVGLQQFVGNLGLRTYVDPQ
jgi:hypothetical protein